MPASAARGADEAVCGRVVMATSGAGAGATFGARGWRGCGLRRTRRGRSRHRLELGRRSRGCHRGGGHGNGLEVDFLPVDDLAAGVHRLDNELLTAGRHVVDRQDVLVPLNIATTALPR